MPSVPPLPIPPSSHGSQASSRQPSARARRGLVGGTNSSQLSARAQSRNPELLKISTPRHQTPSLRSPSVASASSSNHHTDGAAQHVSAQGHFVGDVDGNSTRAVQRKRRNSKNRKTSSSSGRWIDKKPGHTSRHPANHKLGDALSAMFSSWREAFLHMDKDKDGHVSIQELSDALRRHVGLDLSVDEIQTILPDLGDEDGDGKVTLAEFQRQFNAITDHQHFSIKAPKTKEQADMVDCLMDLLHKKFDNDQTYNPMALQRRFMARDINKNGSFSVDELMQLIKELGLNYEFPKEFAKLSAISRRLGGVEVSYKGMAEAIEHNSPVYRGLVDNNWLASRVPKELTQQEDVQVSSGKSQSPTSTTPRLNTAQSSILPLALRQKLALSVRGLEAELKVQGVIRGDVIGSDEIVSALKACGTAISSNDSNQIKEIFLHLERDGPVKLDSILKFLSALPVNPAKAKAGPLEHGTQMRLFHIRALLQASLEKHNSSQGTVDSGIVREVLASNKHLSPALTEEELNSVIHAMQLEPGSTQQGLHVENFFRRLEEEMQTAEVAQVSLRAAVPKGYKATHGAGDVEEREKYKQEMKDAVQKIHAHVVEKYGTLRKAFRAMDENHNGILEPDELRTGLKKHLGLSFDDQSLDQIIHACDINGDNFIEFQDWTDLFQHQEFDSMAFDRGTVKKFTVLGMPKGPEIMTAKDRQCLRTSSRDAVQQRALHIKEQLWNPVPKLRFGRTIAKDTFHITQPMPGVASFSGDDDRLHRTPVHEVLRSQALTAREVRDGRRESRLLLTHRNQDRIAETYRNTDRKAILREEGRIISFREQQQKYFSRVHMQGGRMQLPRPILHSEDPYHKRTKIF